MAALVTKAKPSSIQTPSAFLMRSVYRFADPTGWTGDQWRLIAREPINRMAKQFIIREIAALSYVITSNDKDDKDPKKYIERWDEIFERDGGFDLWATRMIDDACIVPFGAASEVGYKGDELDWVVHVDGATLMPTYEDKTPYMQVNPDNWEQRVYFKKGQLARMLIYARPDIRYKEYQVSPTEASFLEIEALSKIYLYYLQQLSDTPPSGILDVMDMSAADAVVWAENFRELLEGTDPIKVPLLTDHTIPAKFIPFGRSPQDLNVVEQFKRFAEMLLAKYGLSIGDLRLFEHESTKAGERVSQMVTERSGIGYWATKFERYLSRLLPEGLLFEFKQPRPERELVEAQRKGAQLATLQALTGNKPLIDVKDAVEEALALELFQTEVSPAKEEEPPKQALTDGSEGRPFQQQPENGKKPQEVLDQEADRDLSKSIAEIVAKQLGAFDPKGPGSIRFTKLWRKIFEQIGESLPASFKGDLGVLAAEWDAAKAAEEQKAKVDFDKTIELMLEADDWWLVPTSYDDELGDLLEEMYLDGFDKAALDIEKLRGGSGRGLDIAWDVNDPRVIDFVEQHGAEMVQNVNNGTKFYLRSMIKGMLEEGYPGPADAVKRIRYDIFGLEPGEASKFTDNRIRSIVNYETNRAMSSAGYELRASLGLKLKQWFVNLINPCDICLGNQAQGVVKADFQYDGVFGAILYPPAHPQTCRCVATAVEGEVRALGSEPIVWPYTAASKALIEKGGSGSGNFGHSGRPGKRGGSADSRGSIAEAFEQLTDENDDKWYAQMTGVVPLDAGAHAYLRKNWPSMSRGANSPDQMIGLRSVSDKEFTESNERLQSTLLSGEADFEYDVKLNAAFEIVTTDRVQNEYDTHGGDSVHHLYHGTDMNAAQNIGKNSFATELGEGVNLLGRGNYLADDSALALQYIGRGHRPDLSSRSGVIIDASLKTGKTGTWDGKTTVLGAKLDTMHATRGRQGDLFISDNEWVVRDSSRILPNAWLDVTRTNAIQKGGSGSGNFGHGGRPGKRGGSAGRGGVQAAQSALAGYKSRNEVVGALGLRDTVHLNQMIKHGMPSVKKGNRRYVKWPEAETWFNAYTGAGKGKAGITAANKAVGGGVKPPKVANPPKPPSKPLPPAGGQEVSVKAGGMNSDTSHIRSHGAGPNGIVPHSVDKRTKQTLGTLPQEHVDAVKNLHYQTDSQADRYTGNRSGWAKSVGGYHTGYGEVALLYADGRGARKSGYKKWDKTTVVHEAGHAVEKGIRGTHFGKVNNSFGNGKTRRSIEVKVSKLYFEVKDKGLGGRGVRAVSAYAKTNKWENFCESYSAYVYKPKSLKRAHGAMYDFLRDDIFNGVEYTK